MMLIEICKYFNDHQTACSLMIDDLVPVAVTNNGVANAWNDWGFLMDEPGSLYQYFDKYLLQKYPEIKGTIFLPVESHHYIPTDNGYEILNRDFDMDFIAFLNKINPRFEFAFHGIKHAWEDENGVNVHEFRNIESEKIPDIENKIDVFYEATGITFEGGKFPGYGYNATAIEFVNDNSFKWWALDVDMLNKKSKKNLPRINRELNIVEIPTNLTGDILKHYFWRNSKRRTVVNMLKLKSILHPIDLIRYYYDNGIPITIQEHFQNQTTRGTRQPINIYDDIWSLDQIFGLLRGLDIWHATCGEIARYYKAYQSVAVQKKSNRIIINSLTSEKHKISLKCQAKALLNISSGEVMKGIQKKDYRVYNNVSPGEYELK